MGGLPCDCTWASALAVLAVFALVISALFWRNLGAKDVEPFLNKQRKKMTLIDKNNVSPDTRRLIFALESPNQPLGLPVGHHLRVYAPNKLGVEPGKWNGLPDPEESFYEVCRKYTPVSSASAKGRLELVIKIYKKQEQPPFVDGGKVSQHIESLDIGDTLDVDGPFGRLTYNGKGSFSIGSRVVTKKKIGLLAGGTGLTPVFQLIRRVFEDPSDPTELFLIYANKTEEDILLRDELEELEKKHPGRISVWFTLDRPPPSWRFSSGYISKEMIRDHLPPPGPDTLILCCGPPAMVEHSCINNLLQMGYDRQDVASF